MQRAFLIPHTYRIGRFLLVLLGFGCFIAVELLLGSGFLLSRPYFLLLPVLPFIFLLISARLELGIVALLFCMMWVRFGLSTGTASKLPISLLFALFWGGLWLVKMALEGDIRFIRSPLNKPVLYFIIILLLSTFWSRFLIDPQVVLWSGFEKVQLGTVGVTIASITIPILCINLIKNNKLVKICYGLAVAGSLFYLPFYTYEVFFAKASADTNEISLATLSRVFNSGGLFPLWMCTLSLAMLFYARNLGKWQRFFIILCLGGWLFRLFVVTLVRISGWLPALMAMLVILFLYSRKLFFFFLLASAILIAINYQTIYDATVVQKEKEGTLSGETSRQNLWNQAFQVSQDHPLLGTGPAGYGNYYMVYFRDLSLSTHNNYLDMLLQYGLIGLGIFLWLCFSLIKELWQSAALQQKGSFEHAFTIGAFAGSIGMMIGMWLGDWVIPFAYNQTISGFNYTAYNWVFSGLALALGQIARKARTKPGE